MQSGQWVLLLLDLIGGSAVVGAVEEARTVDAGASSTLPRGEVMMAGKPSPSPNYHLTEINQLDIKKPRRSPGRGTGASCADFWTGCLGWGGEKPIRLSNQLSAARVVPSAKPASELSSLLGAGLDMPSLHVEVRDDEIIVTQSGAALHPVIGTPQ